MDKKSLREKYLELRKEVLQTTLKNLKIYKRVTSNKYYKSSKVIGIYANLSDEVDTTELILNALNNKKEVVLPVIIDSTRIEFYKIKSLDDLVVLNDINLREPIIDIDNLVLPDQIDLFIVPGVCFDKNKNRIGYGKGYYDRYLANSSNSHKIGLAYDEQVLLNDTIESEDTDVKVDEVITDKRLIK